MPQVSDLDPSADKHFLDSHHDLPCVDGQIGVVEAPVELLLGDGLIGGVVVRSQVLVGQSLGGCYPLLGIEHEHALQEVNGRGVGVLELVLERLPLAPGKGLDESQGLWVPGQHLLRRRSSVGAGSAHILARNGVDNIIGGRSQELRDDGELVDVILAWEERLALEHLGKDAACAPDIHLDVVLLPCEHDLGGAVVPGRNVARHLGILDACETKVANLQVAVLVDQYVTRLEVSVNHAGRVDVFQAAHNLVEEVLDELLFEGPRGEQPVEIGAQQLRYEVAAVEGSAAVGHQVGPCATYMSSSGEMKMSLSEMTFSCLKCLSSFSSR